MLRPPAAAFAWLSVRQAWEGRLRDAQRPSAVHASCEAVRARCGAPRQFTGFSRRPDGRNPTRFAKPRHAQTLSGCLGSPESLKRNLRVRSLCRLVFAASVPLSPNLSWEPMPGRAALSALASDRKSDEPAPCPDAYEPKVIVPRRLSKRFFQSHGPDFAVSLLIFRPMTTRGRPARSGRATGSASRPAEVISWIISAA